MMANTCSFTASRMKSCKGRTGRKSYVEVVNAKTGEPLRHSFGTLANYEPDFKLSHNGKYFGITSL